MTNVTDMSAKITSGIARAAGIGVAEVKDATYNWTRASCASCRAASRRTSSGAAPTDRAALTDVRLPTATSGACVCGEPDGPLFRRVQKLLDFTAHHAENVQALNEAAATQARGESWRRPISTKKGNAADFNKRFSASVGQAPFAHDLRNPLMVRDKERIDTNIYRYRTYKLPGRDG